MVDEEAIAKRWEAMKGCLDERQRRLWAASEARSHGRGGVTAVARATGMAQTTVRDGLRDLDAGEEWEAGRVRRPGAGRPAVSDSDPGVTKDLDGLLEPVTVGDPERVSVRWTSKSAAKLAEELRAMGHVLVDRTVLRLLREMGFSTQGNYKTREGSDHPDRDAQFRYLNAIVAHALVAGQRWKRELARLAEQIGIPIRVLHYPPGTSKWNRIEHRLFSYISINWRGKPLTSYQAIVNLIAATTTTTGLKVYAHLDENEYPTKIKVTDAELAAVTIKRHLFHGDGNYTVHPSNATRVLIKS